MSDELAAALSDLGRAVRTYLLAARDLGADSTQVGFRAGDAVFEIDRKVEPVLEAVIAVWPDSLKPVLMIAEGVGDDGRRTFGGPGQPRWRILVDPIDGTRGLMYDKRSAWFLACGAPAEGDAAKLSDATAAVMVELPVSKQNRGDVLGWSTGAGLVARREDVRTGGGADLTVAPSAATDLINGFAVVSDFFLPGVGGLASELANEIAAHCAGAVQLGGAAIFNDQYISTGGQLVELAMGRDRFCCDLRPLFFDIAERRTGAPAPRGLVCHPYDMAGLKAAQAAGVIVTDGFGNELDATFSVDEPVHWCGYANPQIRQLVEPVVQGWLKRNL